MNTHENEHWLAQLKRGDEVAIFTLHAFSSKYRVATVDKVTKQGRHGTIIVDGKRYDRRFGHARPDKSGRPWTRAELVPLTDRVRAAIRRKENEALIAVTKWRTLSDATVERVAQAIRNTVDQTQQARRNAEVAAFERALEIVAEAKESNSWHHAETYLRVCLHEAEQDASASADKDER